MPRLIYPGDFVLTRNGPDNEDANPTPGRWNHAAVYVGPRPAIGDQLDEPAGWIVEAQVEPSAVIASPWRNFRRRYAELVAVDPFYAIARRRRLDVPVTETDAHRLAAESARQAVGLPYRLLASIFTRKPGHNCVTVCRRAFEAATGKDPGWRIPDDIAEDLIAGANPPALRFHVAEYGTWTPPADPLAGYTIRPADTWQAPPKPTE